MCEQCNPEYGEVDHIPKRDEIFLNYLSSVIPDQSDNAVKMLLNMALIEIFVRTPPGKFQGEMEEFASNTLTMLDEENHPSASAYLFKERDLVQKQREQNLFAEEADDTLEAIFETHGVLNKDVEYVEEEDDTYGTYL